MKSAVQLLLIDPQKDFCHPDGALFVPGADTDMICVARMLDRLVGKIDLVHVSLDTHSRLDIAHPGWWVDAAGEHPKPFTLISAQDVRDGLWKAADPYDQKRSLVYVQSLEDNARYSLIIWPEHCLKDSWGHEIEQNVSKSLRNFNCNLITKGTNPFTEHYSAIQAEVPDENDVSTLLNTSLIDKLREADTILIAGEASSHCVANTIRDLVKHFEPEDVKKLVFLNDASSAVSGFHHLADSFLKELTGLGMQVSLTTIVEV